MILNHEEIIIDAIELYKEDPSKIRIYVLKLDKLYQFLKSENFKISKQFRLTMLFLYDFKNRINLLRCYNLLKEVDVFDIFVSNIKKHNLITDNEILRDYQIFK